MPSTRCHAAVVNGEIYRNVIVSYDSIDCCRQLSLHPFEGEVHSTDVFNGAILILPAGADFDISSVHITASGFSSILSGIASELPVLHTGEALRLLFLPL